MSKNTLLSELINYISANSSGNVVIAAPSSGYALDVTGTGRFTGDLTIGNGTADSGLVIYANNSASGWAGRILGVNATGSIKFQHRDNSATFIDIFTYNANGGAAFCQFYGKTTFNQIGIGTSSPTNLLGLQASSAGQRILNIYNGLVGGGDYVSIGSQYATGNSNVNSEIRFGNELTANAPSYLAFATATGSSPSERMRITSGGSVQIGNSSSVGSLKITDSAKSASAGPFLLSSNDTSNPMQLSFTRNINLYYSIQSLEQGVSYRSIYLNLDGGGVYAGTQRIDNNSDARVKENIQPVTNALNTVMSLNGKKFNMIDEDNILRYGFIAQEVQPVLNNFVTESTRSYKNGENVIDNLLTLESSGTAWAALLVEAIKELKSEIDLLKQQ